MDYRQYYQQSSVETPSYSKPIPKPKPIQYMPQGINPTLGGQSYASYQAPGAMRPTPQAGNVPYQSPQQGQFPQYGFGPTGNAQMNMPYQQPGKQFTFLSSTNSRRNARRGSRYAYTPQGMQYMGDEEDMGMGSYPAYQPPQYMPRSTPFVY